MPAKPPQAQAPLSTSQNNHMTCREMKSGFKFNGQKDTHYSQLLEGVLEKDSLSDQMSESCGPLHLIV